MKFENFEKVITAYKEGVDYLSSLADMHVDLFESPICASNDLLFEEWLDISFCDEASDLIYWWLFEDVEKIIYKEDTQISIKDLKDLYTYILDNKWIKL